MSRRHVFCATALAVALPLAGCTSSPSPAPTPAPSSGGLKLVSYDSCEQLEKDVKQAAKASVGPYGFPGAGGVPEVAVERGGARTMADAAAVPAAGKFSGTNNHEADADEPDLVKTDGRRIVTVSGSTLRVVDAALRKQTGSLDLGIRGYGTGPTLLLSGDAALVLSTEVGDGGVIDRKIGVPVAGRSEALLVSLSGAPRIVSRWQGDGRLIDARLTGGTARVVLRSAPRITFPDSGRKSDPTGANRKAIEQADVSAWLPAWSVTTGSETSQGTADCSRVTRPPSFSGGSLVSILTFDLSQPTLGSGDAVTVAADSDTVYATGSSMYVASDERWQVTAGVGRADLPVREQTDIHRFTIDGTKPPAYAASGSVPGYLVNQYALSESDGHLRVATTSSGASAVRVLAVRNLAQVGVVDGLGKGERIYSVRFLGPVGYVVTFRQTDPLYTIDLSDPAKPRVTGELKITGYSAHLQPAGEGRLIGVGQEADTSGRVSGTQVSLFDVRDPGAPRRLTQHQVPGGQSEAEWDPHALLWWPATQLLVLPVSSVSGGRVTEGALALRVTDQGVTQVGMVSRPGVRRSLVVGDVLWTVTDAGLQASSLATLDEQAWIAF
ncbi:beta-propeller domain-containing protein [Actinoplanes sp. RD1]|uniref:beta-propeller domain-containing protein n=1 Tax=Actinoplanes sp. RD1 TaxID=3064538 RepID=UPI002741B34B|nr:beta-propeller domain-containing protein [Actinoplanes sp. RD1]